MIFLYLSVVILIVVTVIHIVLHMAHWQQTKDLTAKMKAQVDTIRALTEKKVNLLDLNEFASLDGYMKDAYKKYMVELALPMIMQKLNAMAKGVNLETMIKENDATIQATIKSTIESIDPSSVMNGMQDAKQTESLKA